MIRLIAFMFGVAVAAVAVTVLPATADPPAPSGSIAVADADLTFGGYVQFDAVVDGRVNGQAYTYVRVVCWTDPTNVVYQWSSTEPGFVFPLVDQAGLQWDGQPASCQADLVYRVDKQRGSTIETMASVTFEVD